MSLSHKTNIVRPIMVTILGEKIIHYGGPNLNPIHRYTHETLTEQIHDDPIIIRKQRYIPTQVHPKRTTNPNRHLKPRCYNDSLHNRIYILFASIRGVITPLMEDVAFGCRIHVALRHIA